MNVIPQRLFDSKDVHILLRDGNTCILRKELHTPVLEKEGYISNHAISILLAGEQRIRSYEGEFLTLHSGEMLMIPRGLYQVSDLLPQKGSFISLLFYFDDALIRDFLSQTQVSEFSREEIPTHLKLAQSPNIQVYSHSLMQVYQSPGLGKAHFLPLKILELLHLLNDEVGEQQLANFLFRLHLPKKRTIKSFIEHNYDKPLKIEDYAYLTGRSISTFRRDFKAQFHTTPQKWIKEKRLKKALQLTEQKRISVTQLAYEVGYENVSYFIKEFKAYVGVSPKQYLLNQHRGKN